MAESLKKVWNFILDLLFPIKCIGCQKEGRFLCNDCLSLIILNKIQNCPKCNKPSIHGRFCKTCLSKFEKEDSKIHLSGIITATSYENKLLQKAIHTYKYRFVKDLSSPLGQILADILHQTILQSNSVDIKNIVLIPVPLHKKRILFRGFNQAELLSREISSRLNLTVITDVLAKVKNTKPQMELDKNHRRENIKDAFLCTNPEKVKGKTALVIDDVCTTSSTLAECAKALYPASPKKIWGLVLAKA
jgi:ComF family protein